MFDLGYLGVEKDFSEPILSLPYKKKRNLNYHKKKKSTNKLRSKKRIVIEHTICRLKKYRILADIFRNKLRKYNKVSDIVTGLVNYRIINPESLKENMVYPYTSIVNSCVNTRIHLLVKYL